MKAFDYLTDITCQNNLSKDVNNFAVIITVNRRCIIGGKSRYPPKSFKTKLFLFFFFFLENWVFLCIRVIKISFICHLQLGNTCSQSERASITIFAPRRHQLQGPLPSDLLHGALPLGPPPGALPPGPPSSFCPSNIFRVGDFFDFLKKI